MVVKPLDIHPSALAEFKSSLIWCLDRNRAAAEKFAAALDQAIALVAESPSRWPKDDSVLESCPETIPRRHVYREKQDTIQILAIAHGHRRPEYWKDGL